MNHDAVDHVSRMVGPHLKNRLESALRARSQPSTLPSLVGDLMQKTLRRVDEQLISDFLALLPRDPAILPGLDSAHAKAVLNDKSSPNGGFYRTARAFGGTTALLAVVDPTRSHLWVANVGDCVAGTSPPPPARSDVSCCARARPPRAWQVHLYWAVALPPSRAAKAIVECAADKDR